MPIKIKLNKEAICNLNSCNPKKRPKRPVRRRKCRKHPHGKPSKRPIKKKFCDTLIFGFDGEVVHPVRTNNQGVLLVETEPSARRTFHEETFPNTMAHNEWSFLPAQETAEQITYTYALLNRSVVPVLARLEISPDGIHYALDCERVVEPFALGALVPSTFLRFTRIGVRTLEAHNGPVELDIFYQSQSAS